MGNPVNQHDVPKTYLRRFVIDPQSEQLKSIVYCLWSNQFQSKIEQVSVDSNKFKIANLYTVISDDGPYIFEQFFSENVEPYYNPIMLEINEEKDLSQSIREELVIWLYFSKMRNRATRSNFESLTEFSIKIHFLYKNEKEKYDEKIAKEFAKYIAKKTQLELLIDEKMMKDFISCVENKHWIILRSHEDNVFLTNDNPGFSIKQNIGGVDYSSLDKNLRTNDDISHYFVLSPKYCLLISPYLKDIPLGDHLRHQKIEYVPIGNSVIDFINSCTAITRTKFLVSNDLKQIEKYKKMHDSPRKRNTYNKIKHRYIND